MSAQTTVVTPAIASTRLAITPSRPVGVRRATVCAPSAGVISGGTLPSPRESIASYPGGVIRTSVRISQRFRATVHERPLVTDVLRHPGEHALELLQGRPHPQA